MRRPTSIANQVAMVIEGGYLVNGIRLQGIIDEQDQYTLLLKNNNLRQLVYKHAITTILPSQALPDFTTEPEAMMEESA